MSLADAMLEIAKGIEEDIEHNGSSGCADCQQWAKGIMRQIRSAVKAAEGQPPPAAIQPATLGDHRALIDKERERLRLAKGAAGSEDAEQGEWSQAEMVGGPGSGDMAPIMAEMPIGAKCQVGGGVYELRGDGKLYHLPPGVVVEKKVLTS